MRTLVKMTRARHQGTSGFLSTPSLSRLRRSFDDGALLLADDNDRCIEPPPSGSFDTNVDDVPLYTEFFIIDSPYSQNGVFPRFHDNIGIDWSSNCYNLIIYDRHVRDLIEYGNFSRIKQVSSLPDGSLGCASYVCQSIIYVNTPLPACAVHEWIHLANVPHRREIINKNHGHNDPNNYITNANAANNFFEDKKAIMWRSITGDNK